MLIVLFTSSADTYWTETSEVMFKYMLVLHVFVFSKWQSFKIMGWKYLHLQIVQSFYQRFRVFVGLFWTL